MEEDANEASARDHRAVIGVHTRASTHSCRDPRHAHGRGWLDELVAGNVTSVEQIAAREKCSMACQFDPGDLREQTRDGARNGFGEPRDREPKLAQANPQPAAETVRRVFEPAERPQNAGYSSETGKRRCALLDSAGRGHGMIIGRHTTSCLCPKSCLRSCDGRRARLDADSSPLP